MSAADVSGETTGELVERVREALPKHTVTAERDYAPHPALDALTELQHRLERAEGERADYRFWNERVLEQLEAVEERCGRIARAAVDLVQIWDMSADSLGPEWVGMGERVDALNVALSNPASEPDA